MFRYIPGKCHDIPPYSGIFRDIPPYSVIFRHIPAYSVYSGIPGFHNAMPEDKPIASDICSNEFAQAQLPLGVILLA
jgi:hypothetical protein